MRMAREAGIDIRPPSPPSAKVEEDAQEYDEEEIEEENRGLGSKERSGRLSLSPQPKVSPPEHPNRTNVSATIQYPTFTSSYPQPPSFYDTAPGKQPPQPPIPSSTISSEPIHYSTATISSDPVFYETSTTSSSDPVFYNTPPTAPKDPGPRTNLPGQKDFASRLMSKYGWQKGQSLGSTPSSGLVTPLLMKADKDRKGTGIILNKNKIVEDHGPFGKMTRCIVLANVVGLGEVDEELVDEIGSECREKVLPLFFPLSSSRVA
jgi:splicing factor 45